MHVHVQYASRERERERERGREGGREEGREGGRKRDLVSCNLTFPGSILPRNNNLRSTVELLHRRRKSLRSTIKLLCRRKSVRRSKVNYYAEGRAWEGQRSKVARTEGESLRTSLHVHVHCVAFF